MELNASVKQSFEIADRPFKALGRGGS